MAQKCAEARPQAWVQELHVFAEVRKTAGHARNENDQAQTPDHDSS